jgi:hypothetical protein
MYLISSAVTNSVYLTFDGFFQIFPIYYGDGTIRAIDLCKIHAYIPNALGQIAKTMLVLASIDRFLITSDRASFRAFSTPKRAKYLIVFSFSFWFLFVIHVPIMRTVVNGQCTTPSVYSKIYSVYSIIFVGLIPTIVPAIFGYLTYHNMRQMHIRVQPVVQNIINANIFIRRRDRDLIIVVIAEIFVHVATTTLFSLIQLEMMISQYTMPNKSFQYLQIELFILNIAIFLLFVNCAAPFYTYLISSKPFRRDFKQLIIKIYRKLRRQTPVRIISRRGRTLIERETPV